MNRRPHGGPPARDRLLDELADVLAETDPLPDRVLAMALAAQQAVRPARSPLVGLLRLLEDSAFGPAPVGLRQADRPRRLAMAGTGLCVEVELHQSRPGWLRVFGVAALEDSGCPVSGGEVELRHPTGSVECPVDEVGRFRLDAVPSGPISLVLRVPGHRAVAADWATW